MDARRAVALTGPQLEKLSKALRHAYPNRRQLEMLLRYGLDRETGTLESGGLESCIFALLETAKSEGWLHSLINAAVKKRPDNVELNEWVESVGSIAPTEAPANAHQQKKVPRRNNRLSSDTLGNDSPDNLVQLADHRRGRAGVSRIKGSRGATVGGVTGKQHVSADWDALAKALRSARFGTSDWRAMSSRTSRLRKELARFRTPHPEFPERVDALIAELAKTLAIASEESARAGTVRSAGAQCAQIREWLLHLLTASRK